MAYIKPDQVVVKKMIETGTAKARLTVKDLLICQISATIFAITHED